MFDQFNTFSFKQIIILVLLGHCLKNEENIRNFVEVGKVKKLLKVMNKRQLFEITLENLTPSIVDIINIKFHAIYIQLRRFCNFHAFLKLHSGLVGLNLDAGYTCMLHHSKNSLLTFRND